MTAISLVLADDQPLLRSGLAMLLSAEPDLEVVAQVDDGVEAIEAVSQLQPHVAVLDVRMPRADGLAATRAIRQQDALKDVGVLILTAFDTPETVHAAFRAGAAGLVLKDAPPEQLKLAIRSVAAGHGWIEPRIARDLIVEFAARSESASVLPTALAQLTPREREVLVLAADGLRNADIASRLYITEGTVKTHLARVLTKLDLNTRAQAVAAAYRSGLVLVNRPAWRPA